MFAFNFPDYQLEGRTLQMFISTARRFAPYHIVRVTLSTHS